MKTTLKSTSQIRKCIKSIHATVDPPAEGPHYKGVSPDVEKQIRSEDVAGQSDLSIRAVASVLTVASVIGSLATLFALLGGFLHGFAWVAAGSVLAIIPFLVEAFVNRE